MEKQLELDAEETFKKIEVILNKKRKRMEDSVKAENIKKIERIDEEIERIKIEKKNIQEGEEIQLTEIRKEIEKEKNDYFLALMEDIEIKKTIKGFKEKLNKYH